MRGFNLMRRLSVFGVAALVIAIAVSAIAIPSTSAAVDGRCGGNSARINTATSFYLSACAKDDRVWVYNDRSVPVTFTLSGDLRSPTTFSDDAAITALRNRFNLRSTLWPGETLSVAAGPGPGSIDLGGISPKVAAIWFVHKALGPVVWSWTDLGTHIASAFEDAQRCIANGGNRTPCIASSVGKRTGDIVKALKDAPKDAKQALLKWFQSTVTFAAWEAEAHYTAQQLTPFNDTLDIDPAPSSTTTSSPTSVSTSTTTTTIPAGPCSSNCLSLFESAGAAWLTIPNGDDCGTKDADGRYIGFCDASFFARINGVVIDCGNRFGCMTVGWNNAQVVDFGFQSANPMRLDDVSDLAELFRIYAGRPPTSTDVYWVKLVYVADESFNTVVPLGTSNALHFP